MLTVRFSVYCVLSTFQFLKNLFIYLFWFKNHSKINTLPSTFFIFFYNYVILTSKKPIKISIISLSVINNYIFTVDIFFDFYHHQHIFTHSPIHTNAPECPLAHLNLSHPSCTPSKPVKRHQTPLRASQRHPSNIRVITSIHISQNTIHRSPTLCTISPT